MSDKKSTTDRFNSGTLHPMARRAISLVSGAAPGLAAAVGERLFLHTRRHPAPEREREILARAERHEVDIGSGEALPTGAPMRIPAWSWRPADVPLHLRQRQLPVVLLVHGWEGRGAQLGAFVEPLVADGFQVVTWDAPGHGEAPGGSSNMVAMARALEAVAARWAPAAIVAHSAGAIPTTYALSRRLAVDRLVYLAPGADLEGYSRWFAGWVGLAEAARLCLQERVERRIGVSWEEIEPLLLAPKMTAPLLAISDRDDRDSPLATVEALVAKWPGARLEMTEGLGHRRILRDPEVVARTVAFVTGADAAAERRPRSAGARA